jgi:hypothetical protein
MANLLDYLAWRGDLPLDAVPLNDVDALIFARLSYVPFDGIAEERVPLFEAAQRVLDTVSMADAPRACGKEDQQLLTQLLKSPRYADIVLDGYENIFDPVRQEQFAALTLHLPDGSASVAFRGTDGTLVGWKEDFNMSFSTFVPAQLDAVRYLTDAASRTQGSLYLSGHSKGGNLAVYAAAFCDPKIQERIRGVRNFDGPGFTQQVISQTGFVRILPRVRTYLPQSSVVGMLLEHEEAFTIVESRSVGIYQHNVYLWEIKRGGFVELQQLSASSQLMDRALKDWVAAMPAEDRGRVINGLYTALSATQAETVRDVREHRKLAALKAVMDLDPETRALTLQAARLLYQSLRRSMPQKDRREILEKLPISALLDRLPFGKQDDKKEQKQEQ